MSISSGLLGLWQEVARSDSWATESRSARCAEDWTAEAGEGQLARLGAGCSGGEWAVRRRSAARMSRPIARLCTQVATQQRSNAAQAVHGRGGERWATWSWRTAPAKGGRRSTSPRRRSPSWSFRWAGRGAAAGPQSDGDVLAVSDAQWLDT